MTSEQLYLAIGMVEETYLQTGRRIDYKRQFYAAVGLLVLVVTALIALLLSGRITVQSNPQSLESPPTLEQTPRPGQGELVSEIEGQYAAYSMEDLVRESSLVLSGTITARSDGLIQDVSSEIYYPFTDWTLETESVYRGTANEQITVRTGSWQSDSIAIYNTENGQIAAADENDSLSVGSHVLLFLYRPHMGGGCNTLGDYYYILGHDFGCYSVREDPNQLISRAEEEGIPFPDFLSELQALSEQYEVDEYREYKDCAEWTKKELENGEMSQEEYNEFWERMSEYAMIVN